MIEIDGKIISLEIFRESFLCDLGKCKGICCVEGNSGAPMEEEEGAVMEREYPNYSEYMTPGGRRAVEEQGFMVTDADGDLTTPLVDGAECAYAFLENGITLCAVEKAWREGKTLFRKPISCHLYPIRVAKFGNGTYGLNYHRWDVCVSATNCGAATGIPVYRSLRDALVRRFGPEFYAELEEAERYIKEEGGA